MGAEPTNTAQGVPLASPPVQTQDAGLITTLPPAYDQTRGTPMNFPPQFNSTLPQGHNQQGAPYLSNPTHGGNSMPQHEPQLPQQGLQPGMVAAVVPLEHLDNNPQWIDCPWCQRRTHTRVEREGSSMQVLTGVILCLFCVCLACLPCIAGWFEDTHQFCSNCGKKVATRSHEGILQVFRPSSMHAVPSQYPGQHPGQYPPQQQQQQHQLQGKVA